jgi:hypothetical protein
MPIRATILNAAEGELDRRGARRRMTQVRVD